MLSPHVNRGHVHKQLCWLISHAELFPHSLNPHHKYRPISPGVMMYSIHERPQIEREDGSVHPLQINPLGFSLNMINDESFSLLNVMPNRTVHPPIDPDFFILTVKDPLLAKVILETI